MYPECSIPDKTDEPKRPQCFICHNPNVIEAIAQYEGEDVIMCAECHDQVTFLHGEWSELPPRMVELVPGFSVQMRTFRRGRITALMSLEPFLPGNANGIHLSILHPERHATLSEIRAVVDDLVPEGKVLNYYIKALDLQDSNAVNLWEVPTTKLILARG